MNEKLYIQKPKTKTEHFDYFIFGHRHLPVGKGRNSPPTSIWVIGYSIQLWRFDGDQFQHTIVFPLTTKTIRIFFTLYTQNHKRIVRGKRPS
jgi:hypothetical protein